MLHVLIHLLVHGIRAASKASNPGIDQVAGSPDERNARARLDLLERQRGAPATLIKAQFELASVITRVGKWPEASRLLDRAAAGIEGTSPAELDRVLGVGGAELILQGRLQLVRRFHGEQHPLVATALVSLAGLRERMGRHADAQRDLEQALSLEQEAFGSDHPRVSAVLLRLAQAVVAQGRHREAIPLWGRALAIAEKSHGPDHPALVPALEGLAATQASLGLIDPAETSYLRAISLQKRALGGEHPEVQRLLDVLGALYQ